VGRILAHLEARGRPGPLPWGPVRVEPLSGNLGPGEMVKHCSASNPITRFPIRAVQVGWGSEFIGEFEEACQRLGIWLVVLPPRGAKLNGWMGMQRTFRDEVYTRSSPRGLMHLQAQQPPKAHMALGGLAPLEFLAQQQTKSVRQKSRMGWPITAS